MVVWSDLLQAQVHDPGALEEDVEKGARGFAACDEA